MSNASIEVCKMWNIAISAIEKQVQTGHLLNQACAGRAPGFLKSLSFRQSMCVCVHPRGHK